MWTAFVFHLADVGQHLQKLNSVVALLSFDISFIYLSNEVTSSYMLVVPLFMRKISRRKTRQGLRTHRDLLLPWLQ